VYYFAISVLDFDPYGRRNSMKMPKSADVKEKSRTGLWSSAGSALQSLAYQEKPLSEETGRGKKAHMLLLAVLAAACLLPFVGKAFNMDDPLFIWTAEHIQEHPLDPYGFNVNWYGTEIPMSDINKNPPLASYFMAVVASVFGWSEPVLHVAFLLPAVAVIIGTYLIARRYCVNPLLAGLVALLNPVFLVSSTTVMSDIMMLAFWVFAVYFWMSGLEKNSTIMLALAVVLIALSALTKYFGLALIPLLLLYAILKRRAAGRWVLFMLLPIAVLAGYQWATGELYGRGLLMDAGAYAVAFPSAFGKMSLPKVLVGLSFTGGCVLVVLFFTHWIWSWRGAAIGVILAALVAIIVASSGSLGNYRLPGEGAARWIVGFELGIFMSCGVSLLAVAFLDVMQQRDADSTLLFLWFMGTFAFAVFVNWTTAARSILPLVPAAGILIARRIERQKRLRMGIPLKQILSPLIGAAVMALAVTWADYSLANSARAAGIAIHDKYMNEKATIWFTGHWGFQYYMQSFGARSFDENRSMPAAGDIFIVPGNSPNIVELPPSLVRLREVLDVPSGDWITTMNLETGAGFYSDTWGPLPFAVGAAPLDHYHVFEVRGL
jgi:4-amino-4-deoxy-L-arabinose transferase-like glycosyltransferase